MKNENPLLSSFNTPFQSTPFDKIKPYHFEPALKNKIKEAKKAINKIIKSNSTPTFANTLLPIEIIYDDISRISQILFNLNSAETSKEIQVETQKISPMLTKFMSTIMLKKKLFKRIKYIYENRQTEELTPEELRLTELTFKSMKRNGANFSFIMKFKLIGIQMRLSKLTLKFNENVLAETNNFELHIVNKTDLDGLPTNEIEAAALAAKNKGKEGWVISLQYPVYSSFIKYAHNRVLREKLYRAFTSKGNHDNANDNKKNIIKIINLRLKHAKILGYKSYAEYVLEERMANKPQWVKSFLDELHTASKTHAYNELGHLREYADKLGFKDELMPWDVSYYSEKLKTEKYGFNEEMVNPYFKLNSVIEGVFDLANKLYGLTFKEVIQIPVYHQDFKTYEVYDENEDFLSILYADFHPRENKQNGAWMTEFRSQSNINGKMQRPHISICCNFTKPLGNKPSLLTFSEVNTFLHEFGHAIHGMLANTTYPSLSGTNVFRDFVELPSQIMENWLCEFEWLEKFAKHYQTGEPIPDDLLKHIVEARNFQAGYNSEKQILFGILDLEWHSIEKPYKKNVVAFELEKTASLNLLPIVNGSCISTSFSHIFSGGYAAGYYGYKWAEVLDADAFSVFKNEGIFNREVSNKFRKEILEKGGTAHPLELFINFKGEKPSIAPLLERSGLKPVLCIRKSITN